MSSGALMLYSIRSLPAPALSLILFSDAVAKARTMKVSSPSSPSRRRSALFEYIWNVSSPVPP